MEICVCISCVPDTTYRVAIEEDGAKLNYDNTQLILNPLDNYTLTRAIQLKSEPDSQVKSVTLITVGDASCDPILKKAMAMGADHAIRIDTKPQDTYTVGQNLSKVIESGKYDLVFMGKESIDYNSGGTPPTTAALLNYPFVENTVGLNIISNESVNVTTENSEGRKELEASLPLVIAGQKGLVQDHEIIIPNMRALMAARQKHIEVIQNMEITSLTKTISYETPPAKGATKYFSSENLEELAEIIHTEYKNQ